MGKSSGGEQVVNEYYMSMHVGVSHPVDSVTAIGIGDRELWTGDQTETGSITIQSRELFGGPTKEGGAGGKIHILHGRSDQVMPDDLAQRLGRANGADCPAFRGKLSAFFVDGLTGLSQSTIGSLGTVLSLTLTMFGLGITPTAAAIRGFYWGANNPYLKNLWFRCRRASVGLNPAIALIPRGTDTTPRDSNPAHMIYEAITNAQWGQGTPAALMNTASFNAAATKLYAEKLGLSYYWNKQSDVEAFLQDVLNHIDGACYTDPATGLVTLTLARDDYDADTLDVISPDNAKLVRYDVRGYGELINEVTVSWTNPTSRQPETITLQDPAGLEVQGEPVSTTKSFPMARSKELATDLLVRELRLASTPLANGDLILDRSLWDVVPGKVYKLVWPERGIASKIIRIGKVDRGKVGSPEIKVSFVEDIYSYAKAQYTTPASSAWEQSQVAPEPIEYQRVITLPHYLANLLVGTTNAGTLEYPETLAGVMGSSSKADTYTYDIQTQVVQPDSSTIWMPVRTVNNLGRGTTTAAIAQEATTTLTFTTIYGVVGPVQGGFVMFGSDDVADSATEIAMITNIDGTDITLARGVMDTVPRDWPAGTVAWFFAAVTNFSDGIVRADTEDPDYKILTRTSKGVLPLADASIVSKALTGRPHYPNRPANVKVEGTGFTPGGAVVDTTGVGGTTLAVTWSNRNRLLEETQIVRWADATVTPEAGQTTTIRVVKLDGTVLATRSGLTGTSYALLKTDFGSESVAIVRVSAVRDGFESLTAHEIRVRRSFPSKIKLSGDMATGSEKLTGDASAGSDKLLQSGS